MKVTLPLWVAEAKQLPIAFAQVREDPRIDAAVVRRAGDAVRVCMIASGGCTVAVLVTLPQVAALHVVDPNPAQLAIAQLKLHLLQTATPQTRLALLGHTSLEPAERRAQLAAQWAALQLPDDVIGTPDTVAAHGPDYAGRYERCFAALQAELAPKRDELRAILGMSLREEQTRRFAPETAFGKLFDRVIDNVMSLENLVALFGSGATQNPAEPFSRHFARRIRHALATLPANTNPFLWQMLLGEYPAGYTADWFALPEPAKLPEITWQRAFMLDALRTQPNTFDVVHLSNVLDWLSPEEATATLDTAANALRPNGTVIIRQLNSTLDIPALGAMFAWEETCELHANDRSFFYRGLHIGRKK